MVESEKKFCVCMWRGDAKRERNQLPILLLAMASRQNFGRGIRPGHHVALPLMIISEDLSVQPWVLTLGMVHPSSMW